MQCNIDQVCRRVRIVNGRKTAIPGLLFLLAGLIDQSKFLIVAGAVLILMGSFMIFEGTKGWCVLRAMGFKTKI